jgi:hypothetical protein
VAGQANGPQLILCAVCGVELIKGRADKYFHVDSIAKDVPMHDAIPAPAAELRAHVQTRLDLGLAAKDMLDHHNALHPGSDCDFAVRLTQALRTRE